MKTFIIAGILMAGSGLALAQTDSYLFNANETIPVGNPVGLTLATNLTGISGNISDVTVTLDITGGYTGDLYAYLSGPNGGFAVLLNRTGVSSTDAFGYTDAGFNITLDDSAANGNIHYYENTLNPDGGQLTGTWAPDGENVDPSGDQVGSAPATALLSSFDGTNPNGTWTLFVADLSNGSQGTLATWGLNITTAPVPEPQIWTLGVSGAFLLLAAWKRRAD